MNNVRVVIGANYGDEGKGLLTDLYCSERPSLNVRFNGGAQAGHTVVTPGKLRHVFSHFGSGSFAGARTLLTQDFIVNPILYHSEMTRWRALGQAAPVIFVSRNARVTTPADMLLNMLAEEAREARGETRHGSVGVGIYETTERDPLFPLHVSDLADIKRLEERLQDIYAHWLPQRARALNCHELLEKQKYRFNVSRFIADCMTFFAQVQVVDELDTLRAHENLVFEGAQGLGLDFRADPIHATPTNTGLTNVLRLLGQLQNPKGVPPIEVTYCTRAYLTRHGAGPLPNELDCLPFPGVYDDTNKPHPYQGVLRYALLDLEDMFDRINDDIAYAQFKGFQVTRHLAVTCLDQAAGRPRWRALNDETAGSDLMFLHELWAQCDSDDQYRQHRGATGPCKVLFSTGPTREDVARYKPPAPQEKSTLFAVPSRHPVNTTWTSTAPVV